jgi:hypothetical protein
VRGAWLCDCPRGGARRTAVLVFYISACVYLNAVDGDVALSSLRGVRPLVVGSCKIKI